MSIAQGQVSSFKQQILLGQHNLEANTLKMALYLSTATLNLSTTAYTASGEVTASGYTAGGATLSSVSVSLDTTDSIAYVNFADVSWTAALTARAALIYNASVSNKAVAVLDFGADKTSTTTFTVSLPPNNSSDAVIRVA